MSLLAIIRNSILRVCRIIPFNLAIKCIRILLESQGLGFGAQVYKSGEIEAIKKVFARQTNNNLTIFDVGANRGEYTKALILQFECAKFHLFEPAKQTFKVLDQALPDSPQVKKNNIALGKISEKRELFKESKISRIASLSKLSVTNAIYTELVEVTTLDAYVNSHNIKQIDLLKIDVEGHELDVLCGGTSLLKNKRIRVIQFEFGEFNIDTRITFKELFTYLKSYGYTIYIVKHGRLVKIHVYDVIYEYHSATNYFAVNQNEIINKL